MRRGTWQFCVDGLAVVLDRANLAYPTAKSTQPAVGGVCGHAEEGRRGLGGAERYNEASRVLGTREQDLNSNSFELNSNDLNRK